MRLVRQLNKSNLIAQFRTQAAERTSRRFGGSSCDFGGGSTAQPAFQDAGAGLQRGSTSAIRFGASAQLGAGCGSDDGSEFDWQQVAGGDFGTFGLWSGGGATVHDNGVRAALRE